MMAFFLTMPTSITMPIMAMTDRSILNSISDEQRADAGRRQAGDDGDRVDEALVENAEHDIGGEDRGQHQDALPLERLLEHLRGALEAGDDGGRQARLALDPLDCVDRLAERIAGREIERDRHRRLLALVVDLQRTDRRHQPRHRVERDRSARSTVFRRRRDSSDGSAWNSGSVSRMT